jgi:excinuclease ABC subunit C
MTLKEREQYDLPRTPGVYFFKRGKEILYIGKATNLDQRTKSYFKGKLMETRGPLIVKMVEDTDTLECIETESALEALLLESHLIKKHQPYYNSREKDDKSYNYVVITDEDFPRVFTVRKRQLDILRGKKEPLLHVFGPFPQGQLLREALNIIRKIFPFYGKKGRGSYAQEFYQQMGLEPGSNKQSSLRENYLENIRYIALFFEGKKRSIIKTLKKRMMQYAKNLEFEKADILKKQMFSLEHIRDVALMRRDFELGTETTLFRIEAYDIAHHQGQAMVGVMVVHNGREIDSSEHRLFNIKTVSSSNDTAALSEVLQRRLKNTQWVYPSMIVVDGGVAQKRAMEKVLREAKLSIPVVSVVKDERHKAKTLLGQKKLTEKYSQEILAINAESHRFAISAHKRKHRKDFLA